MNEQLQNALNTIEKEKSGLVPPFLSRAELDELLAAWHRLYENPDIQVENKRFIVDHKMYREPAFAKLATHPVVQETARRAIGEFQLAGYAVVATPPNGDKPTLPHEVPFHVDHVVYSDVPVSVARDTFVCIWLNFEDMGLENGPFTIARDTHKFNIGWEFFKERPELKIRDMQWDRRVIYNVGPAGTTSVYSGKTWHSGTTNCSKVVRKGLNMNFVPAKPLDSLRRNIFDVCALSEEDYAALEKLIAIPDYLIARDPSMVKPKAPVYQQY